MRKVTGLKIFSIAMISFGFLIWFLSGREMPSVRSISNAPSLPPKSYKEANRTHNSVDRVITIEQNYIPELSQGFAIDTNNFWAADSHKREFIKSSNSGKTWEFLSKSAYEKLNFFFDNPFQIFFVDKSHGWITKSGETWETPDGGATWNKVFDKKINDIFFHDDSNGWMSLESEDELRNYRTGDGGKTWQPCEENQKKVRLSAGAFFVTPLTGWAYSTTITDIKNGIYTVSGIAKTEDGGCQWKEIWKAPDSSDARYADIFFINEKEGWFYTFITNGLFQTIDGGKTWHELSIPIETGQIQTFFFKNKLEGWLLFGSQAKISVFYKTTDGGKIWSKALGEEFLHVLLTEVSFPRVSEGLRQAIVVQNHYSTVE